MARLGLTPTAETVAGAVRNAALLRHTHPARICKELYKEGARGSLLAGPHVGAALTFLAATGTLNVIIPEWEETQDFEQNNLHHSQSVEGHLLSVARHARALGAGPETVFAAALHDIGKPRTSSFDGPRAHFYRHEEVGAEMAREICVRLGTPGAVQDKVVTLVALHMMPGQVQTQKGKRRLAHRAGEHYSDLITLHHAGRCHEAHSDLQLFSTPSGPQLFCLGCQLVFPVAGDQTPQVRKDSTQDGVPRDARRAKGR